MLAVLSDIHANLEALEAVLADALAGGITACASLGDLIGFNGDPAGCVMRLAPLLVASVRGNHEEALLHRGLFGVPLFTKMMDLTGAMLSAATVATMRQLPYKMSRDGVVFVHASPAGAERWSRLSTLNDAEEAFAAFKEQICFFGHTHRACVFCERDGQVERLPVSYDDTGSFRLALLPEVRYLINPGSVGQPRDFDSRAAYALYHPDGQCVTLRRVRYDVESACRKISRTGLPPSFAEALRCGKSPIE